MKIRKLFCALASMTRSIRVSRVVSCSRGVLFIAGKSQSRIAADGLPSYACRRPMRVDYTVSIWKEGNQFIAHAMPLDVASAGATPDAARAALDEAVHLFLATSIEMGTIDQVLD